MKCCPISYLQVRHSSLLKILTSILLSKQRAQCSIKQRETKGIRIPLPPLKRPTQHPTATQPILKQPGQPSDFSVKIANRRIPSDLTWLVQDNCLSVTGLLHLMGTARKTS